MISKRTNSSAAQRELLNRNYVVVPDIVSNLQQNIEFAIDLLRQASLTSLTHQVLAYINYKKFSKFVLEKLAQHPEYIMSPSKSFLTMKVAEAISVLERIVDIMDSIEDKRISDMHDLALIDAFDSENSLPPIATSSPPIIFPSSWDTTDTPNHIIKTTIPKYTTYSGMDIDSPPYSSKSKSKTLDILRIPEPSQEWKEYEGCDTHELKYNQMNNEIILLGSNYCKIPALIHSNEVTTETPSAVATTISSAKVSSPLSAGPTNQHSVLVNNPTAPSLDLLEDTIATNDSHVGFLLPLTNTSDDVNSKTKHVIMVTNSGTNSNNPNRNTTGLIPSDIAALATIEEKRIMSSLARIDDSTDTSQTRQLISIPHPVTSSYEIQIGTEVFFFMKDDFHAQFSPFMTGLPADLQMTAAAVETNR